MKVFNKKEAWLDIGASIIFCFGLYFLLVALVEHVPLMGV